MDAQAFTDLMAQVTRRIAGTALDDDLEAQLNSWYPPDGGFMREVRAACAVGMAEGWMCNREHAGIKYGRVVKPGPATHGFSIDVVEMNDIAGGHHRHPNGEVDLVMPMDDTARFDGRGAGWLVYGPETAHAPSVAGGKALVLYLLPEGAIEFSSKS